MPELPEVETVRRGLAHLVTGYRISHAEQLHPRAMKSESIAPLATLAGAKITGTHRRGKFLWLSLDRPHVLVAHLGMSGQFLIQERNRPSARHVRAEFKLSRFFQNRELVFNDQRTFGWLSIEEVRSGIPTSAQHIAPDPFDPFFEKDKTIKSYQKRNIKIKTALLNQEIMSGVGNIYADETLWRAKVHPETNTSDLTTKKLSIIIECASQVMQEAIDKGGTSFDDLYININGESGFFEQSLAVYGQENQPCPRCARQISRITFGGRSSHYCSKCQVKV